jgi:RNA polymerase sigma factor (sigma-70 family)
MSRGNLMDESEDILIQGCIEWDRNSQNRLYKKFCSKMFAVVLRYSKNKEEAEDTLQEGFMKVFDNLKNFKREGSLEGWIRRIMVNSAIQKYRQSKPQFTTINVEDNVYSLNGFATETTLSQIGTKELMKLIQKLPPKCQMVFNLYVFEGMKHREIAEQLGITEGTSKSNLSDARVMLQKQVKKLEGAKRPSENGKMEVGFGKRELVNGLNGQLAVSNSQSQIAN